MFRRLLVIWVDLKKNWFIKNSNFISNYAVRNSATVIHKIENIKCPSSSILVSFDVTSPFSNVALLSTLQRVRDVFEETQMSREIIDEYIKLVKFIVSWFQLLPIWGWVLQFWGGTSYGSLVSPLWLKCVWTCWEWKVLLTMNPYLRNIVFGDVMLTCCVYGRAVK